MFAQLKKISIVSIGNIMNAFLGVLFLTSVARSLSIEEFGKYALLTTLLVSMSKVIDFGSNSTYVAENINATNNIDSFFTLKILMLLPAYIVGIGVLALTELLSMITLVIYTCGIIAYALNITMFALFQKRKMYKEAVLLNTVPAVVKALLGGLILLGFFSINLSGAFTIFALSVFFSFFLYFKLPAEYRVFNSNLIEREYIRELAKKGFPGGVALIIQHSWPTISNTIAKIAKDFTSAGIFSVADKIANIFTLISVSVFTVLLPENAQRKRQNKTYDFLGTFYIAIFILLLAIVATVIGTFLLPLVFGHKYIESIPILWILILSSALTAIHTFMDNYFYVHQNVKPLMYINLLKLALMIGCGFALIQRFELIGLAYAQLIAGAFTVLTTVIVIKKLEITQQQ